MIVGVGHVIGPQMLAGPETDSAVALITAANALPAKVALAGLLAGNVTCTAARLQAAGDTVHTAVEARAPRGNAKFSRKQSSHTFRVLFVHVTFSIGPIFITNFTKIRMTWPPRNSYKFS